MKSSLRLFFVGAIVASMTASASADVVAPSFQFSFATVGNSGVAHSASQYGSTTHMSGQQWFFNGSCADSSMGTLSWSYLVDPDPFITGTVSLTNTTALTQTYIVDFALDIDPVLLAGSYISGQATGSVTDANGSGLATIASNGATPIYSALGDGQFIQGLMSNFSHSANSPYGSSSFSGGSFGNPNGSLMGPAINSTIGIRFAFSLTSGDSISFSSVFVANPVPAPGALALLLGAGLTGIGRRRR